MNADRYTSVIAKAFVLTVFLLIVIFSSVQADSIGFADYAYSVPTSLCHDPLLGPSMIIYSDCSVSTEEPKQNDDSDILHGVNSEIPTSEVIIPDTDTDNTEVVVIPDNDEVPVQDDNTTVEDNGNDSNDDKPNKGNNGHGNNTDGIDVSNPGNGPKNNPDVDDSAPIDDEKKNK